MISSCFRTVFKYFFCVLLALLLSGNVMASDEAEYDHNNTELNLKAPPGDLSIIFLGNIFGVVDGVLAGTGSQMAGTIFGVFNAAVLALGGIVISYSLLISTMNTAQDGTFLGQRWSSIWVPVRTVGGAMLLMPKASGYCLMQIFIMWVVIQGVGAADKVWSQALSYLNRGGAIVRPNVDPITNQAKNNDTTVFDAAYGIFVAQVCMASMERSLIHYRSTIMRGNECDHVSSTSSMGLFCSTPVPSFIESVKFFDEQQPKYMPTFTQAPYDVLTGICGSIQFNDFSLGTGTTAQDMGLSKVEEETLIKSRAVAVNQMYEFSAGTANQVVENSKLFNSDANGFNWGVPLRLDLTQCTATTNPYTTDTSNCTYCDGIKEYKNSACLSWEIENGALSSILLRGTEIQDIAAVYNGMMSASLYIKSQTDNTTNYRLQREFISDARNSGWLLAGAYYFRLAILTSQVLQTTRSNNIGNDDSSSGLKVYSPGSSSKRWSTNDFKNQFTKDSLCVYENKIFCSVSNTYMSSLIEKVIEIIKGKGDSTSDIPTAAIGHLTQPTYNTKDNPNYNVANSAYGFLINSTALILPGQPGSEEPQFLVTVDYNASTNVPQLGKSSVSGGKWKIPGQIVTAVYNYVVRELFNMLLAMIIPMVNMVFFAFVQPPLVLIAAKFLGAMEVLQNVNVNPILGLTNMGVGLIEGSINSYFDMIGMAVGAAFFGPAVLGLIMIMLPVVSMWLGIMISAGTLATFYLPFVPFMIFLFASIGWLIIVIEAMVAAPLIALGVMHPEGDQVFGKSEQAVMMITGIFLRPAMMIMGYIFGIILSYVGIWFVNAGFVLVVPDVRDMPMVDINTGNSVSDQITQSAQNIGQAGTGNTTIYGMWSTIYLLFFMLLVYITTLISVVSKSFELIHMLPDKIMRWISGGNQETAAGKAASAATGDVKQAHKTAGDASSKAIAKTVADIQKRGISALTRQKKKNKKNQTKNASSQANKKGGGQSASGKKKNAAPASPTSKSKKPEPKTPAVKGSNPKPKVPPKKSKDGKPIADKNYRTPTPPKGGK